MNSSILLVPARRLVVVFSILATTVVAGSLCVSSARAVDSEGQAAESDDSDHQPFGGDSSGTNEGSPSEKNESPNRFGDWAILCPQDSIKKDQDACRIVQSAILKGAQTRNSQSQPKRIMLTSVSYVASEKQPILTLLVPLGILLPPGLVLDVDGYDQLKLSVQRCDADGCLAVLPMKVQLVEAFRKAKEGRVTFFNLAGKPSKIRISLSGFGTALSALNKRRNEPRALRS